VRLDSGNESAAITQIGHTANSAMKIAFVARIGAGKDFFS
jgi:hypothetical protein